MTRFLGGLTAHAIGAAALLCGTAACGDSTGPDGGAVSVDQVVHGVVESPGQIVVYSLDGSEGQTVRAFFQATSGDGRDSLVLQLLSPDGATLLARVSSAGSQPALDQRATPVVTLPATGRYRLEVRGADTGTDQGPFVFRVAAIDLAPEVASSALTLGSVVTGESIGEPGDVDEFTFEGSAGDELAAFIQGMDGPRSDSLTLTILSRGASSILRTAFTPGTAESLRAHGTGGFVLPTSGTYVARVAGRRVSITMGYRLEVIRVVPASERAPTILR